VKNPDIYPITEHLISKHQKECFLGQQGGVFWLYGLSGSGKSTLAIRMENLLHQRKKYCIVLDGDNLRSGLNSDLGFSDSDRVENIRRVSEVAKLLSQNGVIVIVSLITPFRESRDAAQTIIGAENFHEVYVKASFTTCQNRDVKGLYAKASQGKVQSFTGQNSKFEEPENNCLIIDTEKESLENSTEKLFQYVFKSISVNS
jgi:adenylylsulfate kinase